MMQKKSKKSTMAVQEETEKKRKEKARESDIQVCKMCGKYKMATEFYISYNPQHETGYLPYCKTCIASMCTDSKGNPDKKKFLKLLQTLDRPYVHNAWLHALTVQNGNVIGKYFGILAMGKNKIKTWADGDLDKLDEDEAAVKPATNPPVPIDNQIVTRREKFEDFKVDENIIKLFGEGFTDEEYFRMNEKYQFLLSSYKEQTNMHTEALVTYVRYKVKEEIAIAQNKPNDAKTWGELAMKQAEKAKINPNQFSQSDLQGGLSTVGEIAKAVEEHQDIIPILPQFKYRPNDAVDFCIWNYINYVRELEGKPLVEYEDVYHFYDERKEQYIKSTGDPYGIFKDDPTESNRDKVKTFITLPEDYNEFGDDNNGV